MDKLVITGGKELKGEVPISGAKNAALPLMCAGLLVDGELTLSNIPDLADIKSLTSILSHLGVGGALEGNTLSLNGAGTINTVAPYDMVRKMRASILVLGPLLARFGAATVSLPGGCAIGNRPIDLHLKGLQKLGTKITLEDGYVKASVDGRLTGAHIQMPMVSVGATENLLMAATLAEGETIISNAAREPEVNDLANALNAMGANISGIGTDTLTIAGVEGLSSAAHRVMPDRIEAGSYAIAGAITRGHVTLTGVAPADMKATLTVLADMGCELDIGDDTITIARTEAISPTTISTQPYPGFATDMQAQVMALATIANGASVITETIFENRFMHVPELRRMGADIEVHGNAATVKGVKSLSGAPVMATDLRASMGLALAGLAAKGDTVVSRVYHLDRGYEHMEQKLRAIGAKIERVKE